MDITADDIVECRGLTVSGAIFIAGRRNFQHA